MFNFFLGGVFSKKKDSKVFLKKIAQINNLSDEINSKQKDLNNIEYELLLENKESLYISLDQFLKFMDKGKALEIKDIIQAFIHIDELKQTGTSTIEVYLIPEEDHLVICPDKTSCTKHAEYKGDPVRITTVKRI